MSAEVYVCQNCGRTLGLDEIHRQEAATGRCLAVALTFSRRGSAYETRSRFLGSYPRREAAGPYYSGGLDF